MPRVSPLNQEVARSRVELATISDVCVLVNRSLLASGWEQGCNYHPSLIFRATFAKCARSGLRSTPNWF
jgi:hypothetical protein